MQACSIVRDENTGGDWLQLQSLWWELFVCVAIEDVAARATHLDVIQQAIDVYFDRAFLKYRSAPHAILYDGVTARVYWLEVASAGCMNECRLDFGRNVSVVNLIGSPFTAAPSKHRTPKSDRCSCIRAA